MCVCVRARARVSRAQSDFAWITQRLAEVADEVCGGRIVSVLEGGYSPPVLRKCVTAHVRALMGLRD